MKFDYKTIGVIISFLSLVGGGIGWTYSAGKETGKLEAEVEFQKRYEPIIVDNITLRAECGE